MSSTPDDFEDEGVSDEEFDAHTRAADEARKKAVINAFYGGHPPPSEEENEEDEEEEEEVTKTPTPITAKTKIIQTGEYPHLNVYEWCQNLSAEQYTPYDNEFIWTTETDRIYRRLTLTQNNLIAIIGNQGSGKTATRENLAQKLTDSDHNARSLKWRSEEAMFEDIGDSDVMQNYQNNVRDAAHEAVKRKSDTAAFNYDTEINRINERDSKFGSLSIFKLASRILSKHELNKIKYETLVQTAVEGGITFLIDFPDYDKHNKSQMLKDLTRFREWLDAIISGDKLYGNGVNVNIVIFFQKELWGGHFAFGKFDVVELKPFTPQQIAAYYQKQFNSVDPFTVEAMLYLAGLSRGIIRWFKKYVRVCLENLYDAIDSGKPAKIITIMDVKNWITVGQLAQDWDRELMELMPKSKGERTKAVEVMRHLFETGGTTQSEVTAQFFDVDNSGKVQCSRLISKLELFGYVKRVKDGRENKIMLVNPND